MSAILLLVLVSDPTAEIAASAMAASAADGLDGRAVIDLERVSKLPSDDEAIHRADVSKAGAVIEVSWPDADGRRAHLHAHLKPSAPWIDRDVTFAATSKPWERGRAVGLAIAAMIPDEAEPPKEEPPPAEAAGSVSDRSEEPTKKPEIEPAPIVVAPPPRPPTAIDVVTPIAPTRRRFDLSLVGELGTAFQDDGPTGGARAGGTWWAHPAIGMRLLGGYRASSVDDIGAHVTQFDGGVGLATRLYASSSFRLALFGDVRLAQQKVTRTRTDGADESRAHWLPSIALTAEGGYSLASNLAIIATLGPELALGKTTLAVRDAEVSTMPRVTLLGGLGLRWSL